MNDFRSTDAATARVLARVRSLVRREVRDSQKCCWIEGPRQFIQAADAAFDCEAVICSPILLKSPAAGVMMYELVRRSAACEAC
ncbi:MAG TPA: hypothetical protein VHD36_11950 [Pirellulales bacterium]|nr:hypothetical protein [Pirellulales bacterium]